MKLITWNCQMAFRKKHHAILALKPDILVVPECENKEKLQFGKLTPEPIDFFWYGKNPHKGIGVFSYADYRFQLLDIFNPEFEYVLPLKVTGKQNFNLIAIWAMPNKTNRRQRYIGQVWSGLNYYQQLLREDTIIIGDFNGNQIWDDNVYTGNFTQTFNFLEAQNFKSLYHWQTGETYGQETQPTFYLYRKRDKPYHLDYCVVKNNRLKKSTTIEVGTFEDWIDLSDHVPLVVEV